jgi:hypothetical protein
MNKKQQKTLSKVLDKPTRADIRWDEIRSLFSALRAQIDEGEGSRIQVVFKSRIFRMHQPHPRKELKKYAIEAIRDFLTNAEVVE